MSKVEKKVPALRKCSSWGGRLKIKSEYNSLIKGMEYQKVICDVEIIVRDEGYQMLGGRGSAGAVT